ncbi:T9SS type A sorting domain-containing protein [Winogradskyella vidalii]|uniref:T9SS type A sorting domain-containing protein n=1 Tax=Winogradskyella vidalii TaxID=2615024 RepID=UPI0015C6A14F|nr:T9SS type A sorting domain-containing protein [Winogradskyella vidalii]
MKFKLLLVFTICAMVSTAQTKSTVTNSFDSPTVSLSTDSSSFVNTSNAVNNNDPVKVYPTYTQGVVYFKVADACQKFKISVYDIYGNHYKVNMYDEGAIDLGPLKEGMYYIKFTCKQISVIKNVIKK